MEQLEGRGGSSGGSGGRQVARVGATRHGGDGGGRSRAGGSGRIARNEERRSVASRWRCRLWIMSLAGSGGNLGGVRCSSLVVASCISLLSCFLALAVEQ